MEAITAKYFRKKKKKIPPKIIVTGKLNCLQAGQARKGKTLKQKGEKRGHTVEKV